MVTVYFQNFGEEPATEVNFWIDSDYLTFTFNKAISDIYDPNIWKNRASAPTKLCKNIDEEDPIMVVYPGSQQIPITAETTAAEDVKEDVSVLRAKVLSKEYTVMVYGCVRYFTVQKIKHNSFCALLNNSEGEPSTWQFSWCPAGNADY
jgi:hypothetical protein